jgi:hypothetical protein
MLRETFRAVKFFFRGPVVLIGLANLVIAVLTCVWLIVAFAIASSGLEVIKKQKLLDTALWELGLVVLGPVIAACFLFWLIISNYRLLIPGLLVALATTGVLLRNKDHTDSLDRLELAFTLGVLAIGFTFCVGMADVKSALGQSFQAVDIEYGPLAQAGLWLTLVGISAAMFKMWKRADQRRNLHHANRMRSDEAYRKLYEE